MKKDQLHPGERPDAFDSNMAPELFDRKFTGGMGDLASITVGTTQIHGRLKNGFTPADGFEVNAEGFVVSKSYP